MKAWKTLSILVAVSALLSAGLTACGKKDDSSSSTGFSRGSLNTDGVNVTSQSTISGVSTSLSVTGISVSSANTGYMMGYSVPLLKFTISLNSQSLSPQIQPGINGSSTGMQVAQLGNFLVAFEGACYQMTCEDVLIHIQITTAGYGGYGGEIKQIAIRKNLPQNRIINMSENQSSSGSLKSLAQLMSEL